MTETHTEIDIGEQPGAEIGEHQEWEMLKSIVYGGLVESITSLGVVSSAASSGAAPCKCFHLSLTGGGLMVNSLHNIVISICVNSFLLNLILSCVVMLKCLQIN